MERNNPLSGKKRAAALWFLAFLFGPVFLRAEDSAVLKYTYRPEQTTVPFLQDKAGKNYLPLMETAKFYDIQLSFDAQSRRVVLKKGYRTAKLVLSQPVFILMDPKASIPIDPLEVISGQLALPTESAGDVLGALLNINVRYLDDQAAVVVGGVSSDEIRQEIVAQAKLTPVSTPTPKFLLSAAPTATPRFSLQAAPTATPEMVIEAIPPTATATEEEEADETPAPIPGQEDLPPARENYQVRRIIIDAGHGGVDNGARGYDKKFVEKQATLDIAKRVVGLLQKDGDVDVMMTRKGDYYITLKYRTTFANSHGADLFVSIHCNANPNTSAYGTDIYVYSSKASNNVAEVAAERENGQVDYLDFIKNDILHHAFRVRSELLAEMVDERIRDRLGQHIRRIQEAPFYVLARVDMPSILIETAFITNPQEEQKLKDPDWRDRIANAIADGIIAYKQKVEGSYAN